MTRAPQALLSLAKAPGFWCHCLLLGWAWTSSAAILLEASTIPGDASVPNYRGQIACDSFSVGFEDADPSGSAGTQHAAPVPILRAVRLVKTAGRESVPLFAHGLTGARIDTLVVRVFADHRGVRSAPYLKIDLDAAYLKSWQLAAGADGRPRELLEILCNRICLQAASGSDGYSPTVTDPQGWDAVQMKPWVAAQPLEGFVNHAPVVPARTVHRFPGQDVKIPLTDLLEAATDPDGDPVEIDRLNPPGLAGAGVSRAEGWIFYSSPTNGDDSFGYVVKDSLGATTPAVVNIRIDTPPPRPDLVATIAQLPSNPGLFQISFNGIPGLRYRILQSETFSAEAAWTLVGYATADDRGFVNYVDHGPPRARFYRLAYP